MSIQEKNMEKLFCNILMMEIKIAKKENPKAFRIPLAFLEKIVYNIFISQILTRDASMKGRTMDL